MITDCLTIRRPGGAPKKFADNRRRFHETVMKPMGLSIEAA